MEWVGPQHDRRLPLLARLPDDGEPHAGADRGVQAQDHQGQEEVEERGRGQRRGEITKPFAGHFFDKK